MKTFRLFSTLLCLVLTASLFTSCKKDKVTPITYVDEDSELEVEFLLQLVRQ